MEWMILPLKRYADFSGRSSRMEYWMFSLLLAIIAFVLVLIFALTAGFKGMLSSDGSDPSAMFSGSIVIFSILSLIFVAAIIVPSIAVTVRRWHDMDKSGWMMLLFIVLGMIPVVGILASIANIVFMCLPGTSGPNKYGEDPVGDPQAVI
jgi:uncharacterized membrane protein YhaH (DUF805 family)